MPAIRPRASSSPSLERSALLTLTLLGSAAMMAAEPSRTAPSSGPPSLAAAPPLLAAADPWLAGATGTRRRAPSRELVVAVKVNGRAQGEAIAYQDPDLGLLIERADLESWRIAAPSSFEQRNGIEYAVLGEVPGVRHRLDPQSSTLELTVEVGAFVREVRALYDLALPVTLEPAPGLFANYDGTIRRAAAAGPGGEANQAAFGYLQLGGFAGWSVLTSDWALDEGSQLRLNTTYRNDFPERIATLRIGDFAAGNSTFGAGLPLGGIQWSTNFATRPGLVQIPLQRMQGQVSVPSTVQVFVNGNLAYRAEVQPGPFSITDIPVVSGAGNVEMVITDLSGRRQVISNPFYASPSVLRAGLTEYSYQVGATRVAEEGSSGLVYSDPAALATHRWGVTDRVTTELHAEATEDAGMLGFATALLMPGGGVLRGGLAASNHPTAGSGGFGILGYERVWGGFSAALETQFATKEFVQVGGLQPDPQHSRDQSRLSLGYFAPRLGSLALSAQHQRNVVAASSTVGTLTYTRSIGGMLTLSISASHERETGYSSGFLGLTVPLGAVTSAALGHNVQREADGTTASDSTATVQRSQGAGPGWGYRVNAAQGGDAQVELSRQGETHAWRVGHDRLLGLTSDFATLSGGMVWTAGGGLHLSRTLGEGFALVRLPGIEGVGVYADNNYVGTTDADGERLVPVLQPYRETRITLDGTALPFDAQLATDRLAVTPRYRAAAVVEFPSRLVTGYTATLLRSDGSVVPAGAELQVDDSEQRAPIGSEGFAYLTLEPGPHRITARFGERTCVVEITIVRSSEPLPDLGTLRCQEQ